MMKKTILAATTFVSFAGFSGELRLNAFFTDHAVLQRERPVPVWGTAEPGEAVKVAFAGQEKTVKADAKGDWRVDLDPLPASKEGRDLSVSTSAATLHLTDILVGEVWLAAGQSNMAQPVWGGAPSFRDRDGLLSVRMQRHADIRYVKVDPECPGKSAKPARQPKPMPWRRFLPDEVVAPGAPLIGYRPLSAVAYYFALELHHALDVPIGVVDTSLGGSPIEQWISQEGYASRPDLADVDPKQRSLLWNGMVADFAPYAIRGALWYQGCSNATKPEGYCSKMHALYHGLKTAFEQKGLPLIFVQLPLFGCEDRFRLQLEQAKFAQEEPNASMITTTDIQEQHTLHPLKKRPIGRRLAARAWDRCYGGGNPKANAAYPVSCQAVSNQIVVTFANARAFWGNGIGVEVAGRDGVYKPGKISTPVQYASKRKDNRELGDVFADGNRLAFESKDVAEPVSVRYLCKDKAYGALLWSDDTMPVGPFEISLHGVKVPEK